ncbi:MAG TPA: SDR family NAD(P)-dependent oxidoreductase [Microbacteriaceae bacterium]|nr:SDR family NAD(P)-dependent oxidoreductase [Microbacteriaceae bacterium]
MNVSYDFSGRTAFITGAGSGIGRASAIAFGAAGADVAVSDIAEPGGLETVELIRAAGGTAEFFQLDVADAAAIRRTVSAIVERFGRLDIAHNNAGVLPPPARFGDIAEADWRRVLDVNLDGVYHCVQAELGVMVPAGRGAIVNTASAAGLFVGYQQSAYTVSKHALIGLTRQAAVDHAKDGIRVNAICPGAVDTPFVPGPPPPKAIFDRLMLGVPAKRMASADEIAAAVLWLASDAASYVNGVALPVDAGLTILSAGSDFSDLDL